MKLTAGEIVDAMDGLKQIATRSGVILPPMAKFKLSKMLNILEPFYIPLAAQRFTLCKELGEPHPNGGWGVNPSSDKYPEYLESWRTMRDVVHEVKITPLTTTMLGDSPQGLEVGEYNMLGPLVIDDGHE